MARATLSPQPLDVTVMAFTYPKHQRELLWALVGASHPGMSLDRRGQHALATLRVAILGALRHGGRPGEVFLASVADMVMDRFATQYPFVPRWRGGLAVPVGWGLMHVTTQFQSMARFARNSWADRLQRAADAGDSLVELMDDAEGGVISRGGNDPDKPPPTSRELNAAWTRFERALRGVCGPFGLVLLLEPPCPVDPPSEGGPDAA